MGYADLATVQAQLSLNPDDPDDDTALARVAALDEELSAVFDAKCGRTFGAEALSSERVFEADGERAVLVFDLPARSVAAVEIGGTWDGVVWSGGEVLDGALYRPLWRNEAAQAWAIVRTDGGVWTGAVRVTGQWADDPGGGVPPEVRGALTWLVVNEYRTEQASPAGEIGPDGLVVSPRNPWSFERVKTVIERYRVRRLVL